MLVALSAAKRVLLGSWTELLPKGFKKLLLCSWAWRSCSGVSVGKRCFSLLELFLKLFLLAALSWGLHEKRIWKHEVLVDEAVDLKWLEDLDARVMVDLRVGEVELGWVLWASAGAAIDFVLYFHWVPNVGLRGLFQLWGGLGFVVLGLHLLPLLFSTHSSGCLRVDPIVLCFEIVLWRCNCMLAEVQ